MNFRVFLASLLILTASSWGQTSLSSEQLYQQAYDSFVKRDYSAASASLDKINPAEQKKADILNLRGAIYKRLGELDNAANSYNDALKINPKDWVPKYNLAEVNFLREQYKSSRTFLEQALASMPESDRLQKQDLILYKVYLTYLLQGDEDKAKLLLDNFDVNSANPVYYFAQAAWSFKKKDNAKAKTWVDSTEGLYSADLRNSYSQALVDIGWMEPAAGVTATTVAADPAATPTPEAVAAASSPTPASTVPEVVPLASSSASPIAANAATAAVASPSPAASASPTASMPDGMAAVVPGDNQKENSSAPWKTILLIVAVLAAAGIALVNLARRSRIVPEPVDNTGYAAIAASSNPETAELGSYHTEGTGAVIVQEDDNAPAPIKIMPIQRDYAVDADAVPVPTSAVSEKGSSKTSRKTAVLPRKAAENAPVLEKQDEAPLALPVTATAPVIAPLPAPAAAPATKKRKTAASISAAGEKVSRTRLVPVPTINVEPVDESQRKRIVVSEIEKMVVKKSGSRKKAAPAATASLPGLEPTALVPDALAPAPVGAPAPVLATTAAPRKKPAAKPKATTSKPKAPKSSAAPVITIPEFDETPATPQTRTVIRIVPEENPDRPSGDNPSGSQPS